MKIVINDLHMNLIAYPDDYFDMYFLEICHFFNKGNCIQSIISGKEIHEICRFLSTINRIICPVCGCAEISINKGKVFAECTNCGMRGPRKDTEKNALMAFSRLHYE